MRSLRKAMLLLVFVCFSNVVAQSSTCADLVAQALITVQDACAATGRNQACYGNFSMQATARADVTAFTFEQQGDVVNIIDFASLHLRGLDVAADEWGVAMMQLQADLPDTLPGQNVTFLLFGDVQIDNGVAVEETDLNPMQAFYFQSGVAELSCIEAPADGILIQTPGGAGTINLAMNDVNVQLGSTAYVQAQPGEVMTLSVIEGQATVTADGEAVVVPEGAVVSVPLDDNLQAAGAPGVVEPYDESALATLPISLLPREIVIAPAADEDAIADAQTDGNTIEISGMGPFNGKFEISDPAVFCPQVAGVLLSANVTRTEYIQLIRTAVMIASPDERARIEEFIAVLEACP